MLYKFTLTTNCCLSVGKKSEVGKTGGYANNFGEPIGGGTRVDAIIITQILKPLLSRLVESRKELQGHENIVSYCFILSSLITMVPTSTGKNGRAFSSQGILNTLS